MKPPPPPNPNVSSPPPPPASKDRTVVIKQTFVQDAPPPKPDPRIIDLTNDIRDLKAKLDVLTHMAQSSGKTTPIAPRGTAFGSDPSITPRSLTRQQPSQTENYYVTKNPEGLLKADIGIIVVSLDKAIAYLKTTTKQYSTGWKQILTEGSGGVGIGNMNYRDDIDASALPALPDPSVKYGDAWRINVGGMAHGIEWSTGDLAVVGGGDTYDRIGSKPYHPDLEIEAFSVTPSTREQGHGVNSVYFSWKLNRDDIAWQSISTPGQPTQRPDPAARSFSWPINVGSYTVFTLTVGDTGGGSDSRTATVRFLWSRYWGTNANETIDDSDIHALSSELSTTRIQFKSIVPAGKYMYLAWPSAWGAGEVWANGFPDTSWVKTVRQVVNRYGISTEYLIQRSANALGGTNPVGIEVK